MLDLVDERRDRDVHAQPAKPLLLPVQRKAVAVLVDGQARHELDAESTAIHHLVRPRRSAHRAAAVLVLAGELLLPMLPDDQLRPNHVERLGHVVPDAHPLRGVSSTTTAGTSRGLRDLSVADA